MTAITIDWSRFLVGIGLGVAVALFWLGFTAVSTSLLTAFGRWLCDRAVIEEVDPLTGRVVEELDR